MFRKILIANRGEIACRIIRTARDMGIATVAVHSDVDGAALHVAMADEAVAIGGAAPADSYLRGDRIIEAALATGAEAIHPGYGFLSENPGFVEAVEAAGLVFIGPSARAIRAMGLKGAAKALMEKAGVPVVPGYHGDNQDDEHLAGAADAIGYPVLVKAVAGGGGKGMRRVDSPKDFAEALRAARAEARSAFGNDAVLVEKFIAKPRHIEVQVFGDGTRAVHLFERDCSLQRRHQKVIEEAPAPGMTDAMRAAMGQAAVRAAEAIGYRGAGTVEFIVDASEGLRPDRFWFMEMNTRLQVEHPVTEAITGIDLVEWQIRVAAGESLPPEADRLAISGHAVEARLYAEDPAGGFLPATGRIGHLSFPPGVRVDSGIRAGDTISPWYDPMIAKIIAHGPTRAIALARLRKALAGTEVAGLVTNLGFLSALVDHPDFAAGDVDTGLVERHQAALAAPPVPRPSHVALAAIAACGLDRPPAHAGFALHGPLVRDVALLGADGPVPVRLSVDGADTLRVAVGDQWLSARRVNGRWRLDGTPAGHALLLGDAVEVFDAEAGSFRFSLPDPLSRDDGGATPSGAVVAPMPGLVRDVLVEPGAGVAAGDPLVVLEAMKMEHTLRAGRAGRVAAVSVRAGDQVEAGQTLATLAPEGEDEAPQEEKSA
ncbi:MAG: acetyl/propionyl/methylcrotonyl-CoA carboxylase subunit alpha [Alphaproteobacteria bacterium]|nr:MAG: acetyl/propionyl/methylcrotonyl-CoA carboxylase subunit alpha [Alphaproteobacteria bacterium]